MAQTIVMPDLGSGTDAGTLINWLKNVGDAINEGDVIAEVETDKATVEVPTNVAGTITQLVGAPGDALKIGAVIGYVGTAEEAASGQNGGNGAAQPAAQAAPTMTPPPQQQGSAQTAPGAQVVGSQSTAPFPKPGEVDTSASVDTGSGNTAANAPSTTGETPIPEVTQEAAAEQTGSGSVRADNILPSNGRAQAQTTPEPVEADGNLPDGVRASPVARRLATEKGIDLRQVHGSGPSGRIVKEDVEGYTPGAAQSAPAVTAPTPNAMPADGGAMTAITPPPTNLPAGAPAAAPTGTAAILPNAQEIPSQDVEIIELTRLRATIARRMTESKQQVPHFYVTNEIDVSALLDLRKQLNASLEEEQKISVNDLIIKAAAVTLKSFPMLNSHFYGDKIVRHKRINIGIAVALPEGGLMNVVAKDADKTALGTMAQQNREMIARARERKVKPEDVQGSTFTVSNLGSFDVEHFSAIINPPESAILAVSTAQKVPVVKEDGTLGVGNRMKVTISVDHRVGDGAQAAQFLQTFKRLIEHPMQLLI